MERSFVPMEVCVFYGAQTISDFVTGLSPSLQTIDQIKVLPRFQEIPFEGLLTDLMWSDPESDVTGFSISKR
jgi:diadenosine tetraphosphatase ApaH/serine/threonine PP2A family protein phosphatase